MILKKAILVTMLLMGSLAYGQISVMAGPSLLRPFGAEKSFVGFHIGGEYSTDDATSYFGRLTHYPGQTDTFPTLVDLQAIDATAPYANTTFTTRTNYTVLTGGLRYYIGDGYETGLSAYGGSTLNLVFNTVKAEFEPFDEAKYILPDGVTRKGNAFQFGLGLQGGVKYGIVNFATVYMDLGMDYMLAYVPSNALAQSSFYIRQFLFSFNIGIRKDIGGW